MTAQPAAAARAIDALAVRSVGARHWAEPRVRAWLEARGWTTLAENAACRYGEIDLVMRDGETIVFVEVRQRTSAGRGGPGESLVARKRARVRRAAAAWLASRALHEASVRFDAALVSGDAAAARVTLVRDAF
jgi:putative endonuclease